MSSSVDFQALLADLRTHFAKAADNDNVLRRLDFEGAMLARRNGESAYNLLLAKVLHDTVPDLEPKVLVVAMLVRHSTGMMGESMKLLTNDERSLYMRCRQTPMLHSRTDADVAQVLLAAQIVAADQFLEAKQSGHVPFGAAQRFFMGIETTAIMLDMRPGVSKAPKLEALLKEKSESVAKASSRESYFPTTPKGGPKF